MTNIRFFIVIVFLLSQNTFAGLDKPFFNDGARGWFWYEEPPAPPVKKKKPKKGKKDGGGLTARQILRKQGIEMEESMAKAQLNPTPENIRDYINKSQMITKQAGVFSSAFKDEILFNPQFVTAEQNLNAPVRTLAGNMAEDEFTKKLMASNKRYSLVFFMRSDCPFCHKFAPILKLIADELNYVVLPISLDGKGLPDFPEARYSPILVKKMQVSKVPTVYLLSPEENITQPVSFGFSSYTDFRNRMGRAIDYINRAVVAKDK